MGWKLMWKKIKVMGYPKATIPNADYDRSKPTGEC
jgi:hypothetical protein